MTRLVYQFGCRPPTVGADLALAQLRAAHEYRNDLVAIERGRRSALRVVDDTPDVRAAIEATKTDDKAARKAAVVALRAARKSARDAAPDDLARIKELEHQIRLSARAGTSCYWGSYLAIEAAHEQARSAPLYDDDAITPSDPRFIPWDRTGQLGVQLQTGLSTADAMGGDDTRVRLTLHDEPYGTISIRVGSAGRDPVWATWPIKLHRRVPDAAVWKWVRLSCRREGRNYRWSCEITVDNPAPLARSLDTRLRGSIVVEWEWSPIESGGIRVARWADSQNKSGDVILPDVIASGIRKPDGIRAVRDMMRANLLPLLSRAILECGEPTPEWLVREAHVMPIRNAKGHVYSAARLYRLVDRWRASKCDVARTAYEMADAWWERDAHLYDYETCSRAQAIRRRRDWYRCLAARWAREYRTVVLSDHDLSREARFGEESDVRFTAGVSELRACIRNAFGDEDAVDARWGTDKERAAAMDADELEWCERLRNAWVVGGARGDGTFADRKEKTANAWAKRKASKKVSTVTGDTARESIAKGA